MYYQSRRAAQRTSQLRMSHLQVYSIGFDSADSNKNMQSPVTHSYCRKRCDPPFMLVMAGVLPAYAAQSGQCSVYLRIFPVSCNTNLRIIRGIECSAKTGRVSQPTVPPVHRTGRVLQPTGSASVSRHLCTRWCAICGAPDPSFCWCGASLVPTMHETTYEQLADFYYSPRNPLAKHTDPTDQRALQKSLSDMANRETVGAPPMLVLGGTCLYLALVGKTDSMPHVQQALLAADCKALRQSLEHVGKGKLFRGGQRPYKPGKSGLPRALRSFYRNLGSDILPLMNNLQILRSSASRAPVVYDLVERVANDTSVKCFGPYFKKRFLEVLCLMGSIQLGGFKLEDTELDFAAAVFPIADNSARGLKRIFPAATGDHLRRQGIRSLCRSMAAHGRKISFCRMHAMLCFKQKQDAGVLSYD